LLTHLHSLVLWSRSWCSCWKRCINLQISYTLLISIFGGSYNTTDFNWRGILLYLFASL